MGAAITCQGSSAGKLECGANWTLDGKSTLTIEGTETLTLTDDERYMLNDLGVRKMVIKPGITEIGEKSFFDMNITEVSLPASLVSLGRYALDNYISENRHRCQGQQVPGGKGRRTVQPGYEEASAGACGRQEADHSGQRHYHRRRGPGKRQPDHPGIGRGHRPGGIWALQVCWSITISSA